MHKSKIHLQILCEPQKTVKPLCKIYMLTEALQEAEILNLS